jgi:hypothetical protein
MEIHVLISPSDAYVPIQKPNYSSLHTAPNLTSSNKVQQDYDLFYFILKNSLLFNSWPSISSFIFENEAAQKERQKKKESRKRKMATGGIKEVGGSANSLEIESLARFAVDDYNKKQVRFFCFL